MDIIIKGFQNLTLPMLRVEKNEKHACSQKKKFIKTYPMIK